MKSEDAKELGYALKDIQDGFYPLGAKSGTGYGVVKEICIEEGDNPKIVSHIISAMEESFPSSGKVERVTKTDSNVSIEFDASAVYYPYYFLKPDENKVKREPIPVGHEEAFKEDLLSGKITCRLTTKTPLIIPDTENEDAFGFRETVKKGEEFHKSYYFMTLNNKPVIPGSEIRGMVSSVYEAVTNSCFRIFDEKYRLSWRMEADVKELEQFKPGRVMKSQDGFVIEEMEEVRYPFYDKNCPDAKSQNDYFDKWNGNIQLTSKNLENIREEAPDIADKLQDLVNKPYKNQALFLSDIRDRIGDKPWGKKKGKDKKKKSHIPMILKHARVEGDGVSQYDHPTQTDCMMLALAQYNRTHRQAERYNIIKPEEKLRDSADFMFAATPSDNKIKRYESCVFRTSVKGYLKISGPNKIDKENKVYAEFANKELPEKPENIIHHRVYLREIFVANAPKRKNRDRLIPEFVWCDKEKGVTYVMSKRCERVFLESRDGFFALTENSLIKLKNKKVPEFVVNKLKKLKDRYYCKKQFLNALKSAITKEESDNYRSLIIQHSEKKQEKVLPVSESAIEKYKILVKAYQDNAEQQEMPKEFRSKIPELKENALVYFREEKSEEESKAVEIVPVRISRKIDDVVIGNRKRIRQDLRPCHGEWIEEEDLSKLDNYPEKKLFTRNPEGLCPACRLFGTGAYKSRVRFGFATLENEPRWLKKSENQKERGVTLPLLERPRPTWAVQHNDNENDKVPGRKFYVHHHGWQAVTDGKHPVTRDEIKPDVNNRTVEPLDKENTFIFDIYFENLEPHELGLLLWSLQLEKGLAHKLGMAKSMGFGSVEIDIENISLRKQSGDWEAKNRNQAEQWIEKGKKKVAEEREWKDLPHIRDLKQLLCFHDNRNISVGYPALEKKEDLPGYKELKQTLKDKNRKLKRKKLLTVPWTPYHSEKSKCD